MSTLPFRRSERVNLSTGEVMIVGGDPEGLEILAQMFAGFGVHTPRRCHDRRKRRMAVGGERELNLIVVDSALGRHGRLRASSAGCAAAALRPTATPR